MTAPWKEPPLEPTKWVGLTRYGEGHRLVMIRTDHIVAVGAVSDPLYSFVDVQGGDNLWVEGTVDAVLAAIAEAEGGLRG